MAINYDNINELIWSRIKMDIANRLDAVLCSIPINDMINFLEVVIYVTFFKGMKRDYQNKFKGFL